MGQYHWPVNLDKREFLYSHSLGDGLKLKEQGFSQPGGIATALHVLLAVSNGRGGGDYGTEHPLSEQVVGRWGGDHIAIIGDYAKPDDLRHEINAQEVFQAVSDESSDWTDITPLVRQYLAEGVDDYYHVFTYEGDTGWIDRKFDLVRRAGK
jgi:hypothetical protein